MIVLLPAVVCAAAAALSVPVRARMNVVGPLAVAAIGLAMALAAGIDVDEGSTFADLAVRMTPFAQFLDVSLLALLLVTTLYVALVEPVYNFFPVALFTAAAVHVALVLATPLPLFLTLVAALVAPAVGFVFRIHENRSLAASVRYFGSIAIGGSLGIAALALAGLQPRGEERLQLTLLLVLLIATFALLLGALPFHTHLATLSAEAPIAMLAIVFGVLMPLTFVSLLLLLSFSGVLPAIASVAKAGTLLSALGLASAIGGALLAIGAVDLRRLVAYSVVSNLGACFIGLGTFSAAGIAGAVATALVTGVAATQQLLSAGILHREMAPEDRAPSAARAPLAAATFVTASLALVGFPPLAGFPARFLVEQISFAVSAPLGLAVVAATLALLIAHLRAALRLFGDVPEAWRFERRPVAAAIGVVLLGALVAGGLQPDLFLRPIADFTREFLLALRPF